MINEEIIEAVDMLINSCENDGQRYGMWALRSLLCDYSEDEWIRMTETEKEKWVRKYSVNNLFGV